MDTVGRNKKVIAEYIRNQFAEDTVGKNAKRIAEYIQNQLKEDQISDQMTLREMKDLFTGSK